MTGSVIKNVDIYADRATQIYIYSIARAHYESGGLIAECIRGGNN